jgi:hypothetical protein
MLGAVAGGLTVRALRRAFGVWRAAALMAGRVEAGVKVLVGVLGRAGQRGVRRALARLAEAGVGAGSGSKALDTLCVALRREIQGLGACMRTPPAPYSPPLARSYDSDSTHTLLLPPPPPHPSPPTPPPPPPSTYYVAQEGRYPLHHHSPSSSGNMLDSGPPSLEEQARRVLQVSQVCTPPPLVRQC